MSEGRTPHLLRVPLEDPPLPLSGLPEELIVFFESQQDVHLVRSPRRL